MLTIPGANPARPGIAAVRTAAAAAGVGGIPRTEVPNRLGGVGRRGAVWVSGC